MDRIHPSKAEPRSSEGTDAELMFNVARHRDVTAFERLFDRHERAAFNLARQLTGNAALAEDAVQDAALRLWNLADKFRPDGNFKGWFLKIVANCSKRHQFERVRDKTRAEQLVKLPSGGATKENRESVENRELTEAMQEALEQLEPIERRLVVLYYGASLDQRVIGRMLDLPQTTVSMKIRQAISRMRASLTTAGFAASIPLLETRQLSDAVIGMESVPPGLRAKILTGLNSAVRHSARAAASKYSSVLWIAIGAMTLMAGSVGWWAIVKTSQAPPLPNVQQIQSPSAKPPQPTPVNHEGPRLRNLSWTFEEGMPADFVPLEPKWEVKKHPVTKVQVLTAEPFTHDTCTLLALPVTVRRTPFVLTIEHIFLDSVFQSHALAFSDGKILYQGGGWSKDIKVSWDKAEKTNVHTKYWFTGKYLICVRNEREEMVIYFEKGRPAGMRLLLGGNGISIKSLAFRDITEAEVPEKFLNPDALIKNLEDRGAKHIEPIYVPLLKRDADLLAKIKDAEE